MDDYRLLRERLAGVLGKGTMAIAQGIVKSVDGRSCEVEMGGITVPDVRLRASLADDDGEILIVPKVGTAVIVGSLSGDLADLAVLSVDHAESVTVNGGKLGGLIKIGELTDKLNALVNAFNAHTHQGTHGPTGAPLQSAEAFDRGDYEDDKIRH